MICKMLIESVKITPGKTINEPLEIEINLWGRLPELLNIPLSDLNDKTKLKNHLLPCSVQRNEWGPQFSHSENSKSIKNTDNKEDFIKLITDFKHEIDYFDFEPFAAILSN